MSEPRSSTRNLATEAEGDPQEDAAVETTADARGAAVASESASEDAERRYRSLLEGVPFGIYRSTPDGRIVDGNRALLRILGLLNSGSLATLNASGLYADPENRVRWQAIVEEQGEVRDFDVLLRRSDGTTIWVRDNARAVRDAEGRIVHYEGVLEDITGRKQAEEAFRESDEKYRALFEHATDAILIHDAEGRIVDVNAKGAALLGYRSRAALIGLGIDELVADGNWQGPIASLTGLRAGGSTTVELCLRRRDGGAVPARLTASAFEVGGRDLIQCNVVDSSSRGSPPEHPLGDRRLEAVARLSGGVAHDFNNLLTVISGYADLLISHGESPERAVEQIKKAVARASALTRQLLAFSSRQVMKAEIVDLDRVLSELAPTVERVIGDDVELEIILHDDPARVRADPEQLAQVVVNLAANARDAMPGGGKFTLETRGVVLGGAEAARFQVAPGPYLLLQATDQGIGMDENTLARIFEPFFTTKEEGMGAGLGLSTVHGIVGQSGGCIDVESGPGEGAIFRIFIPREEGGAAAVAKLSDDPGRRAGDQLTVLVVENEATVRKLIKVVLEGEGYAVLEAQSGPEAMRLLERDGPAPDLLLTDVGLPGMTGIELARQVRARYGLGRILFTSGHGADGDGGGLAGSAVLAKPFTPSLLASTVRDLLGRPRPGEEAPGNRSARIRYRSLRSLGG